MSHLVNPDSKPIIDSNGKLNSDYIPEYKEPNRNLK